MCRKTAYICQRKKIKVRFIKLFDKSTRCAYHLFFCVQDYGLYYFYFDIDYVDSQKKSENNDINCTSVERNKEKEINSQINPDPANDDAISSNDQQNDAVISFDEIEDIRRNEDTSNEISYYQPIDQILRPSSSIEAVNLNSWPTSSTETSPEQHKDKLGK